MAHRDEYHRQQKEKNQGWGRRTEGKRAERLYRSHKHHEIIVRSLLPKCGSGFSLHRTHSFAVCSFMKIYKTCNSKWYSVPNRYTEMQRNSIALVVCFTRLLAPVSSVSSFDLQYSLATDVSHSHVRRFFNSGRRSSQLVFSATCIFCDSRTMQISWARKYCARTKFECYWGECGSWNSPKCYR